MRPTSKTDIELQKRKIFPEKSYLLMFSAFSIARLASCLTEMTHMRTDQVI